MIANNVLQLFYKLTVISRESRIKELRTKNLELFFRLPLQLQFIQTLI